MNGLMLHAGGVEIGRETLELVPLPPKTETYCPVPHNHLVETLATIGKDILTGFRLQKEQYALARDGQQMFGIMTFNSGHSEMGLSIGFRNSYDRSMSVGFAIGASVFCCDNLALSGDITVLKKHTVNVWKSLEDTAINTLYRTQKNFNKIVEDSDHMRGIPVSDSEAFKMIGLMFGNGVLSPRQLPVIKKEWLTPTYNDFKERSLWSLYNGATEALKSCPPILIMEKHVSLHNLITSEYLT